MACHAHVGTALDTGKNIWVGRECLHRAIGAVVAAQGHATGHGASVLGGLRLEGSGMGV